MCNGWASRAGKPGVCEDTELARLGEWEAGEEVG